MTYDVAPQEIQQASNPGSD